MVRLLFVGLVLVVLAAYYAWQALKQLPRARVLALLRPWLIAAGVVLVLLLVVSGRLNGVLALLGVVLAVAARSLPLLLQWLPALLRLWQQFSHNKPSNAQSPNPPAGMPMTVAEALAVLGLQPGASKAQIIAAHRRLMAKVHPDKGGSDFLAAQINRAKALLLKATER